MYFRDIEEGPEFDSGPLSFTQGVAECTMLRNAGYSRVAVTGKLVIIPRLPQLVRIRSPHGLRTVINHSRRIHQYDPEADQDALAKVSDLVFEPTRFQLDLQLNNEGNSRIFEFEDKNDIMVALTGLCWR